MWIRGGFGRASLVTLVMALSVGVGIPTATAASPRAVVVAGTQPSWATPAARVGSPDPGQRLTFRVYLTLRDRAGAEAVAQAVSDPSNPSFRQFLSPAQVGQRFAPTDASIAQVASWLRSAGFSVGDIPANNLFVEATGTARAAEALFSVRLGQYVVGGRQLRAPDTNVSVPSGLATVVSGVVGLDQSESQVTPPNTNGQGPSTAPVQRNSALPGAVPPPDGFRNAPPCSAYWAQQIAQGLPAFDSYPAVLPYTPCGLVPEQLRSAYGLSAAVQGGLNGAGQTVAIVDAFAAPTLLADAQEYARRNDPSHPLLSSQFHKIVFPPTHSLEGPDQCDAAGWYGEQSLDVEAVHAMAPGAQILFVGGADCLDMSLDKALNTIVAGHLASIVSNSYGDLGEDLPASVINAFQDITVQAVVEGIGLYFSSGDSGDEADNLGAPSADFPASSPWVTAVGGTSLGVGQNGGAAVQTGWETTKATLIDGAWNPPDGFFLYGSGGGTSRLFAEPSYQRSHVPVGLASQNQARYQRGRVVPDIAMDGDPNTGMLIGETQTFPEGVHYDQYRIGGTSLSSPLFAGVMALADQFAGQAHGFINPVLYQRVLGTTGVTDVRHVTGAVIRKDFANGLDATDGILTSIRTLDTQGLAIQTRPGYDNVTGIGVPNGEAFFRFL